MNGALRVGILDSGVAAAAGLPLAAGRRFFERDGEIASDDGIEDRLGHGSEVTRLIAAGAPGSELIHAQVFGARFTTTPTVAAAGLRWLQSQEVVLVSMSFGLRADREVLRSACAEAAARGVLLIAAAPAQGTPCFPAAYPGVVAVTGDARCAPGEVSDLQGRQADFGTWCASPERGGGVIAGASVATAHFSGLAAAYLKDHPGADLEALTAYYRAKAKHIGAERRSAGARP